ncbi:hypothetical protein K2173_007973 [Erythroxylum novogranatense]|uniref:BHLH domain-containing protein n=1 Tax=Erythroxylum novogranatense TaxID=1862640 RepID=A0AAV8T887_9ROSI|nr:hypothetical protein K2173_007973 [Erythroxylum novogranatense]
MKMDCGSWSPQHQFDWQPLSMYTLAAPVQLGQQNNVPSVFNPGNTMVSTNRILPTHPIPELHHPQVGRTNEPHGWFYCLPRSIQALSPVPGNYMKQKVPPPPANENHTETVTPKTDSGCVRKRFLVFDQSGDQTSLIFSSAFRNPVQCFTSWNPNPNGPCKFRMDDLEAKESLKPTSTYEFGGNKEHDVETEMHEDTEELNALLYSDDDTDDNGDDEVTSTGHSPSTMTSHDKHHWAEESTEEVASSDGSTKKRKLYKGCNGYMPSLMDTASSARAIRSCEYEDDAESRCVNGNTASASEMASKFNNKKMRKERIRDTVSMLQNIIPGGKGKDPIVVLDEAIHYLKSLKHKANAMGLDSP